MGAANNKRFVDYSRTLRGKEYLQELSTNMNVPISGLEPGCLVQSTRGGQDNGVTWIHPRVVLDYARWLNTKFAVWMDAWVYEKIYPQTDNNCVRPSVYHHQLYIQNETDLHEKVVSFIRARYPGVMLTAGLGEVGSTSELRLANWRKGYTRGHPDLLVHQLHSKYSGMAIEFKTPTGKGSASPDQDAFMNNLRNNGWCCDVLDFYDDCIVKIIEYMQGSVVICSMCDKRVLSTAFQKHQKSHSRKRPRIEKQSDVK
jgi:hypothetical protein